MTRAFPVQLSRAIDAGDPISAFQAPDALFHMCYPFGDIAGAENFCRETLDPLMQAMPDLERRDMIVVDGVTPEGAQWVGTMGSYMGTFRAPFLDIPPTGHLAHIRYHEFYRFEGETLAEAQIIWDIPELMIQARAWPMAPQLGAFLFTPAPATQDGLTTSGSGDTALQHVHDMLTALCSHPAQALREVFQQRQAHRG